MLRFKYLIIIISLILLGYLYELVAESNSAKSYPPPGRLVDVGGYHLHLNCTGSGSPIVVIESGWGDFSSTWAWVQPEIAKSTRVCTYDRAGMGWSEASSEPRTASNFAKELHTLLVNSNEPGPYLLVGHSLGGYTIRVYANDYKNEVAGVVFVDPQNISEAADPNLKPAPSPQRYSPLSILARFGFARIFSRQLGSVEDLPAGAKEAYTVRSVTPLSVQTFLNEGRGMSQGAAQARSVTSLGDLPLIVLSRGRDLDPDSAASQDRYLHLSSIGKHLIAQDSGHRIMIEQPAAVIDAIKQMLDQIREPNKQSSS